MQTRRRDLLKVAGSGIAASLMMAPGYATDGAQPSVAPPYGGIFDVRRYGAVGDGTMIDTPAINKAIDAAATAGGGTVLFPAGTYASYSIHLKSHVTLFLGQGQSSLRRTRLRQGALAATMPRIGSSLARLSGFWSQPLAQ